MSRSGYYNVPPMLAGDFVRMVSSLATVLFDIGCSFAEMEAVFTGSEILARAVSGECPLFIQSSGSIVLRAIATEAGFEWLAEKVRDRRGIHFKLSRGSSLPLLSLGRHMSTLFCCQLVERI